MNLQKKIIIGGIIIIVFAIISSFVLVSMISEQIKQSAISTAEKSNAAYLISVANNVLTVKDFEPQNFDEKKPTFENYYNNIKNDETLRIKAWAKDGTILYSDGSTIVGDNFASNIRFQNSISGQLVSQIKDPIDAENIDEVGYGQLMEIYVPIHLNQPEPVGVIELYFSMNLINESIDKITNLIFIIIFILIGLISLFIIIFSVTVARISKESIEKERFSAIGEVSARIAHDIRNPLSVISTSISVLNYVKNDPEKFEKVIDRMNRSERRITHQIEEVMGFLRESNLKIEEIHLQKMFDLLVSDLPDTDKLKINLPKNDVVIFADHTKITSLFSNLILNALQAIDVDGTITIKILESNDKIHISVEDTGKGIDKDNLEKIFDPLFTTKQEGTGLGLASCKKIIEQHKGTISVTMNPTIFAVTLPKTQTMDN